VEATGAGAVTARSPVAAGTGTLIVDGYGAIVTPAVIITGAGAVVITGDGQLLAPPARAGADTGNYTWPPTAGSITVRRVATADTSVHQVATATVSVR